MLHVRKAAERRNAAIEIHFVWQHRSKFQIDCVSVITTAVALSCSSSAKWTLTGGVAFFFFVNFIEAR